MKFLLSILLIILTSNLASAQAKTSGREFLISIPPNDNKITNKSDNYAIEFYIASEKDTRVIINFNYTQFTDTIFIKANQVYTYSSNDTKYANTFRRFFENESFESNDITKKSIRVNSDEAVTLYVMNSKGFSSDSYLAIPIKSWGYSYIHNSYYDRRENSTKFGAGFNVIANFNNTIIKIKPNGKGNSTGILNTGKYQKLEFNKETEIVLNKNDVFTLQGSGSSNEFDLSGTYVSSNKPVGFISFHRRAVLPNTLNPFATPSRDHLCEMLPATSSWGKEFVSIELARMGKGDFYRVVASQDDTEFEYVSYDINSKIELERNTIKLENAGDFWEYNNQNVNSTVNTSIKGVTKWSANKPILVFQYSYSANWDDFENSDPFMMTLVSSPQFVTTSFLSVPTLKNFDKHYLSIVVDNSAYGNTDSKLKSITINDVPLTNYDSKFILNRIPKTNYYYTRIPVSKAQLFMIRGEVPFCAYLYGFGERDSYGMPVVTNFRNLDEKLRVVSTNPSCGKYEILSSIDTSNMDFVPDESGLESFTLINADPNLKFTLDTNSIRNFHNRLFNLKANAYVVDAKKPAKAIFLVSSKLGNEYLDSIVYLPLNYNINSVFTNTFFEKKEPGDSIEIDLSVHSSYWNLVETKEVITELRYKPEQINNFLLSEIYLDKDKFQVNVKKLNENFKDEDTVQIFIKSNEVIDENFVLGRGQFSLYLSQEDNYRVYSDTKVPSNVFCTTSDSDSLIIENSFCVQNLRKLDISDTKYSMNLKANFLEIGVAFSGEGKVILRNILGQSQIELLNGNLKEGIYNFDLNEYHIQSGTYFITFESGIYQNIKQIMIEK